MNESDPWSEGIPKEALVSDLVVNVSSESSTKNHDNGHEKEDKADEARDTVHHDRIAAQSGSEYSILNAKLVESIEKQAGLEDTAHSLRASLEAANRRIKALETAHVEHRSLVERGLLVKKTDFDAVKLELEREKAKQKASDDEVSEMTGAVMEEANKMVSDARRKAAEEIKVAETRTLHFQDKLADTEILLASHQAQLQELKKVMQSMGDEIHSTGDRSRPASPHPGASATFSRHRFSSSSLGKISLQGMDGTLVDSIGKRVPLSPSSASQSPRQSICKHVDCVLEDGSINRVGHHASRLSIDTVTQIRESAMRAAASTAPGEASEPSSETMEDETKRLETTAKDNPSSSHGSPKNLSNEAEEHHGPEEFSPGPLLPRYRTDVSAYHDFVALLRMALKKPPLSRQGSAQFVPSHSKENSASNGSLRDKGTFVAPYPPSRTASPAPAETSNTPVATGWLASYTQQAAKKREEKEIPLSKTEYFKRALVEDIEPTLRLDLAPDLGFLGRRSILSAITEGTLVVEAIPLHHITRYSVDRMSCAFCGDSRYNPAAGLSRKFRCKTSERPDVQSHPLCLWCTDRLRAVCGYVGFLRQVRDGLWSQHLGEGNESGISGEMRAWEEGVRLREGCFWMRIGLIDE